VSAPLPVRIVGSAARAITEAAERWSSNRPKAPGAFVEEMERALQLLALQPGIGARARRMQSSQELDAFISRGFVTISIIGSPNLHQPSKY